jgi:hypothetical protein
MQKILVLLVIVCALSVSVHAQLKEQISPMSSMTPKQDIICYGKPEDQFTIIEPPLAYQQWKTSKNARTGSSTFEVEYINFPEDAKAAFQKAVDIWATLIESEVTIKIRAQWGVITNANGSSDGILGGASPATYIRDFAGAQQRRTWYPVALAEKMAGRNINEASSPDIFAQFNSAYPNWYFGTDGISQAGKTDLVSVVLHEIGHGLGITKAYEVNGDVGQISPFFSPLHMIYDHFLENNSDNNLVQSFVPPSTTLKTQLTAGILFFRTPQLERISVTNDNRARIFAPDPFQGGSSIAHLDEVFYNGTANSLMTPQIGTAEVIQNPGPIVMKMLADMGWVNTRIIHTRLPNTEDQINPYLVTVQLKADQLNGYNYNTSEVKLHYTNDGTNFTVLPMTATANAHEFSGAIPPAGAGPLKQYGYYVSVKDNLNRTILNPGILTEDGKQPINVYYVFEAGPDTEVPEIDHTPKPFIIADATELLIEADIIDNIGVQSSIVEYEINGVTKTPVALTLIPNSDFSYKATIVLPALQDGDQIKYRIKVVDSSVAKNEAFAPSASQFYTLNVVSLAPTQDSYTNNFNSPSFDFFGDNVFSITTPSGFSNGAIHTTHPYPAGTGASFTSNFVYQLRIPIRVKGVDATIKFDEIVLVEPGEAGSEFGDDDFWDYVIVEGSKDGGANWKPLVDGYDSRANSVWLSRFNSGGDGANPPNSTGVGDPNLYRPRTIDMLQNGNFVVGDEIVIRFRLLTDQLVVGWGWSIDNLKIQIDDTPPTILHNHYDYLTTSNSTLAITAKVTDLAGIDKLFIDYKVKNDPIESVELPVDDLVDQYTLNLTINGLAAGDMIEYRIRSTDKNGNEAILPANSFFKVPVVNFGTPVTQYLADFNAENSDFVGNFYSVATLTGFNSGAAHSTHPYPNGFGLTNTSSYSYMLTKPVTISATNPFMQFSEIAIVEYVGSGVKDFMVVEGSKNNGGTWESLINPYAANDNSSWKVTYDNGSNAVSANYRTRIINLTASGKFVAGDNILIRFRLAADAAGNGWGYALDNLSIQGPITGVDKEFDGLVSVYPNPVSNERIAVEIARIENSNTATVQIINVQGKEILTDTITLLDSTNRREYQVAEWPEGLYLIRVDLGNNQFVTRKFIKSAK